MQGLQEKGFENGQTYSYKLGPVTSRNADRPATPGMVAHCAPKPFEVQALGPNLREQHNDARNSAESEMGPSAESQNLLTSAGCESLRSMVLYGNQN